MTNFKTRVNVFHPYFIIQPKEPLKKIRFPLKRRKAAFIAQIVKLCNESKVLYYLNAEFNIAWMDKV